MTKRNKQPAMPPESAAPLRGSPPKKDLQDELLDEAIEESLPASDTPQGIVPGSLLGKLARDSRTGIRIAVILGSTRPGRNGEIVARWVYSMASHRKDAAFELVDVGDFDLPLLDEPVSPMMGQYSKPHTRAWSEKIRSFDAFVFVTAEYNHGIPGALKNAIDFLYEEWNNKAAGFVSYGSAGGVRAVEQLRLVMAELQVADVREQVTFSLFTDFENMRLFKPATRHEEALNSMLDQVVRWGRVMQALRHGEVRATKAA